MTLYLLTVDRSGEPTDVFVETTAEEISKMVSYDGDRIVMAGRYVDENSWEDDPVPAGLTGTDRRGVIPVTDSK